MANNGTVLSLRSGNEEQQAHHLPVIRRANAVDVGKRAGFRGAKHEPRRRIEVVKRVGDERKTIPRMLFPRVPTIRRCRALN